MSETIDGLFSPSFLPISIHGDIPINQIAHVQGISAEMAQASVHAPHDHCVAWGIPLRA